VGGHLINSTKVENHKATHVLSCCQTNSLGKNVKMFEEEQKKVQK